MIEAIVVRLDGGLGNQLFQYAAGRAAASSSGRELWLDTRAIAARGAGRAYGLGAFALEPRFVGPIERLAIRAATGERLPEVVRGLVGRCSGRRWRLVREGRDTGREGAIPAAGNLVLEGHWQSSRWFADAADVVAADTRFRTPPPPALQPLLGRIAASESVAVHVRRGDYVSSPEAARVHGVLPIDHYTRAAEMVARSVADPSFFLFSDDPEWTAHHLRLPGATTVVRHSVALPDHEDLRLMSLCRHAIIANSTFSWWGAWLGRRPGQVVVAPRRWFRSRETPTGLVPPEWLLVD